MNREGATFALKPRSRRELQAPGDGVHIRARVFIAHESQADYEQIHGSIAPQVVALLTGLDRKRIEEKFGSVVFRDPETEEVIRETDAA